MKTIKLIIDGKEIEAQVNEEDLKAVEKKKRREEVGKNYYRFSSSLCSVVKSEEDNLCFNDACYNTGNYFLTEKECADAARVVSLWLRMKRFANEYNKENFNFTDDNQEKYFIVYDFASEVLRIDWRYSWQDMFQIYFDSKETAQKAINEFYDELLWYFTAYGKES